VTDTDRRRASTPGLASATSSVENREAFDHAPDLPRHNLYVCLEGTIGLANQAAVRDYLRAHPDAASEYGALKKRLAQRFPHDLEQYVFGKTDFVLDVLRHAGLSGEHERSPSRLPIGKAVVLVVVRQPPYSGSVCPDHVQLDFSRCPLNTVSI